MCRVGGLRDPGLNSWGVSDVPASAGGQNRTFLSKAERSDYVRERSPCPRLNDRTGLMY
jgi:hypothetical protein